MKYINLLFLKITNSGKSMTKNEENKNVVVGSQNVTKCLTKSLISNLQTRNRNFVLFIFVGHIVFMPMLHLLLTPVPDELCKHRFKTK